MVPLVRSRHSFVLGFTLAIAVAAALRFAVLDRQIVWNDEVATQLRLAAVSRADLSGAFDGRIRTVTQWRATLGRSPDGPSRILASLRADEPQWPPAFYLLAAGWRVVAGGSVLDVRRLAALIGVAAVGAAAWLGFELFGTARVGLAAAWLVAVSPWQVVYAREARAYSLLALVILLASAALLRAVRTGSARWWTVYGACALGGVYTHTLFAVVVGGHALWMLLDARRRTAFRSFVLAGACVLICWSPWLLAIFHGRSMTIDELPTSDGYRLATFVLPKWLFNLALPFWSLDVWNVSVGWVIAPVLAATGVALVRLGTAPGGGDRLAFLAALALPMIPVIALVDAHWHKSLNLVQRYHFPLALALTLAAAALVADVGTQRARALFTLAAAVLVTASAVSSVDAVGHAWWWDSWYAASYPAIVRVVDAAPHPLLIVAAPALPFALIDNGLRGDTEVLLVRSVPTTCRRISVQAPGRESFWLAPPASLRDEHDAPGAVRLRPVVTSLAEESLAYRFARWLADRGGPAVSRGPGTLPRWATFELWRAEKPLPGHAALMLCS